MEGYQRILCAADFSRLSEAAAERAVELCRRFEAALTLLHVVEYFPVDRSNDLIAPEDVDPAAYRESRAREKLRELTVRLGCEDAAQEVLFSPNSAWHGIIQFIEENDIDLAVLGSHGHHGVFVLLGSTANGVVNRAPCDVLAVHPPQ